MQFTKFSRTGLTVSRLCLGTGTFGKQTDEAESFRVFDKATDAGVNFIDTADVYPGGADLPEVGRSEEIIGLQDTLRLARFVSVQPRYNLLFREIERELLPLAQEENLAVIPFNPLAGGLLSGKYQQDEKPEKGRFSAEVGQFGTAYRARYWHQREFVTIGKLREIAGEEGEALPKLAVAWILANPAITSVILGASRTEQLTDTLAAADYSLAPELKTKLHDLSAEYRRGDAVR